jgi:ankyrin repeat protein
MGGTDVSSTFWSVVTAPEFDEAALHQLLARGADIAARDLDGLGVLHRAAILHLDEATDGRMAAFLRAGADVNATATMRGRGGGYTPLHLAVEEGHLSQVRCLLRHGADKNAQTDDGSTPLMIAVRVLDVPAVSEMLAAGARLDLRDAGGQTALEIADALVAGFDEPGSHAHRSSELAESAMIIRNVLRR